MVFGSAAYEAYWHSRLSGPGRCCVPYTHTEPVSKTWVQRSGVLGAVAASAISFFPLGLSKISICSSSVFLSLSLIIWTLKFNAASEPFRKSSLSLSLDLRA